MHQRHNSLAFLSVLALLLGLQPQPLRAQAAAPGVPPLAAPAPAAKVEREETAAVVQITVRPSRASSLLLTPEQAQRVQAAVQKYRQLQAQRAQARQAQPPQQPQQQARRPAAKPNANPNAKAPDDFLTALTRPLVIDRVEPEGPYLYPQFYLDFMMFQTPSNWVAMINGTRFTAQDPAPEGAELKIVNVERERIFAEWTPKNMNRIRASWDVEQHPDVQVDYDRGVVRFPLRLNQTFSSYLMRAVEGRVTPVKSSTELDEATLVAPRPAAPNPAAARSGKGAPPTIVQKERPDRRPAPAKPAAKPVAGGQKTGLSGLLNNYKKLEAKP